MRWTSIFFLSWAFVTWLSAEPIHAEFVLDDFVDPLRIDVPAQNHVWVDSSDVGYLNANRSVRVNGLRPIPVGFLDVHQSIPSSLVASFPTLTQNPPDPVLGININYELVPVGSGIDLTQGGQNNALILKFDQLTAAVPLFRLLVSVTHSPTVTRYSKALIPIPQSDVPFQLVFPFEEFAPDRGGPVGDIVFKQASRVDILVELALINPSLPEDLDFQMVLTQVQVGRVPEPSSSIMVLLFVLGINSRTLSQRVARHV